MIEIHEVFPEYIPYLLELSKEHQLTFDDGLYSQYKFLKNNPLICAKCTMFVSTAYIRSDYIQPCQNVTLCDTAHALAVYSKDFSPYISFKEIKELQELGVTIGYHGHSHICLDGLKLTKALEIIQREVEASSKIGARLNFSKVFCAPYNDELHLRFYVKFYERHLGDFKYVQDRLSLERVLHDRFELDTLRMVDREMFRIS